MEQSILTSTKQLLGLEADYTAFDLDVMTHINDAFATLNDLGVGPDGGFEIVDATSTWDQLLETVPQLSRVKSIVAMHVRRAFDPPQTGPLSNALNEQILEATWRLNTYREGAVNAD